MFSRIKTIFFSFILFVISLFVIFFIYKTWSQSREIQRLRTDLYRIRVLDANTVLVASQKFKFDDAKIRLQADLIGHYKKVIFNFENATQETIFADSVIRYRVSFDKKEGATRVSGYTLTSPPFAYVEVEKDPLKLSLEIRKEGKDFYTSVLFSSDSTLKIDDLKVKYSGFEEGRSFFSWCYKVGYSSLISDFDNVDLSKFDIGIGTRFGSFIFLPAIGIPENFNFKKTRINVSIIKI